MREKTNQRRDSITGKVQDKAGEGLDASPRFKMSKYNCKLLASWSVAAISSGEVEDVVVARETALEEAREMAITAVKDSDAGVTKYYFHDDFRLPLFLLLHPCLRAAT